MKTNDGGPAFPMGYDLESNNADHEGMSLRDWFAGIALQGIVASDLADERTPRNCASMAYELADAMLAEREKR